MLTDSEVQQKLADAEELLWLQLDGRSLDENPRMWVAFSVLRSVRIYAKSGNGIPGYSGLGLQEALELADSILANPPKSDRDLAIQSYKPLALGISVAVR